LRAGRSSTQLLRARATGPLAAVGMRFDVTAPRGRFMVVAERWYILGFTPDAVVGAWQDARLAQACVAAWEGEGRPAPLGILQAPGDGPYLVHWFLDERTARLLDARGVPWRNFLIGERAQPPRSAHSVLGNQ